MEAMKIICSVMREGVSQALEQEAQDLRHALALLHPHMDKRTQGVLSGLGVQPEQARAQAGADFPGGDAAAGSGAAGRLGMSDYFAGPRYGLSTLVAQRAVPADGASGSGGGGAGRDSLVPAPQGLEAGAGAGAAQLTAMESLAQARGPEGGRPQAGPSQCMMGRGGEPCRGNELCLGVEVVIRQASACRDVPLRRTPLGPCLLSAGSG